MLAPHPHAALEYWFFKVNAPPLALLVDWIARRRAGEGVLRDGVLRVSVHAPAGRAVLFERGPQHATPALSAEHTTGQLGPLSWDLAIAPGDGWIVPSLFPAAALRLFDMSLASAPRAAFTGWIQHGAQRVALRDTPGLVSHYWGRQLPREWWWISASQCDPPGVAVEGMLLRSSVWGLPLAVPLGYLYLHTADRRHLWIAPPAAAHVRGTPEAFEMIFRRPGSAPLRLVARGADYGDLGENIVNTLVGDLEIWEGNRLLARAIGTAGLERRQPGSGSRAPG